MRRRRAVGRSKARDLTLRSQAAPGAAAFDVDVLFPPLPRTPSGAPFCMDSHQASRKTLPPC